MPLLAPQKLVSGVTCHCVSFLLQKKLSCSFCGVAAHQLLEPDMPARGKCSIQAVVPCDISSRPLLLQEKLSCSFCGVAAHQLLEPDMPARGRCSIQSVEDNADKGQST